MNPTPSTSRPSPTAVALLTQADCRLCEHAKKVLGRVSLDHPIAVTEVDLATEAGQALAKRAGFAFAFAPGVLLDGEPFAYGRLSERRLRRALATRGRQAGIPAGDRTQGGLHR